MDVRTPIQNNYSDLIIMISSIYGTLYSVLPARFHVSFWMHEYFLDKNKHVVFHCINQFFRRLQNLSLFGSAVKRSQWGRARGGESCEYLLSLIHSALNSPSQKDACFSETLSGNRLVSSQSSLRGCCFLCRCALLDHFYPHCVLFSCMWTQGYMAVE